MEPREETHHVGNEELYASLPSWLGYPVRFVQFFAPLDRIVGGCSDQQGILRPSTSALGRCGLGRHTAGRSFEIGCDEFVSYGNAMLLSRFGGMDNDVSPDRYVELAARVVPPAKCDYADAKRFYSFDGGKVLKGWVPFVGSHGALRSEDVIEIGPCEDRVRTRVIDSTVRFVLNFSHGDTCAN